MTRRGGGVREEEERQKEVLSIGQWLLLIWLVTGLVQEAPSLAATVTVEWSANSESDLAGYLVYRSMPCGSNVEAPVTLGANLTSFRDDTIPDTVPSVGYAVTAFDQSGNESNPWQTVCKDIHPVTPALTITEHSAARVVIESSSADCLKVTTSTAGSTTAIRRRTITCVR